MEFTPELIAEYNRNKKMRHAFYNRSVELYESVNCHFSGEAPRDLIKDRRPAESENVWKYREKIYESVTKPIMSRVYNSFQKIRKSTDWDVSFDAGVIPSSIKESETPERYINFNLPMYKSVTNWTFSHLLRGYLIDGNGWVAVQPYQMITPDATEYRKPVPIIYSAKDVLDYVEGEFMVCLSKEKVKLFNNKGSVTGEGVVYYVYTPIKIERWVQTNTKQEFTLESEVITNIGYLPLVQTFGIITETSMNGLLAESRLQSMIPYLNEMAREYSDMQAEVVQHIHSTPWYYAALDCGDCNGTGKVTRKEDNKSIQSSCGGCSGSGKKKVSMNSYEAIILPPPQAGDATTLPTPPAGYIQKDTAIVTLQNVRVDAHGYKALAAMNMQFLDASPLNQSGLAKEVDRDELQNTVHSIAEDLVRILDFVCSTIIDMRYSDIIQDKEKRRELYPTIPVPEKYDLLTSSMQVEEIGKLKTSGVDSTIISSAQVELASKMFSNSDEIKNRVTAKLTLDPLAGFSTEDIALAQQVGAVSDEDAIIHFKIGVFLDRAMEEVKDFMALKKSEKMVILIGYAKEQIQLRVLPVNVNDVPE